MNSMTTGPAPHLGDDELLRLIDEDGDALWRGEKEAHLTHCALCSTELAALRADQQLVRECIDAAAFEADLAPRRAASTRFTRTGWLRAAAVLLMIAAPVAALPGLRAWIADAVTGGEAPMEGRTMAAPEAAVESAIVRFVPAAGTFSVVVDAAQRDGVLHIRHVTGPEAALETHSQGAASATEPVFAESRLRLHNAPSSADSYSLALPSSVTRVVVFIGGAQVAELGVAALRGGATVPLARP
jgi:hypothetical protein